MEYYIIFYKRSSRTAACVTETERRLNIHGMKGARFQKRRIKDANGIEYDNILVCANVCVCIRWRKHDVNFGQN